MPVRIYDIAKKLGIESKEVLSKAKELGITGAKVPSSSLDKITAEYLEQQLGGGKAVAVAEPPPAPEPVLIVSAPPAPPPATAPVETPTTPLVSVAAVPIGATASSEVATEAVEVNPAPAPPAASTPVQPPAPPKPGLGEKVGFIQLPQKPPPRIGARGGSFRPPPRPAPMARPVRAADRPAVVSSTPQNPGARAPARPAAPSAPLFVPPATGEIITLKPPIIVRDLAEQLKRKPFQLIADLME